MLPAASAQQSRWPLVWGGCVLVLGIFFLVALGASGSEALLVSSLVLMGLVGLVIFVLSAPTVGAWLPTASLLVVLALSLVTLGGDEGVDLMDIGFGVSLVLYVGLWYSVALASGLRTIRTRTDVAALLFMIMGVIAGTALGVLFGSGGVDFRSDLTCMLAFTLFFPVRELCIRYDHGPRAIAAAIIGIGLFAALTNAFRLTGVLTDATELYEVVDVRLASGEIQIIAAFTVSLLWLAVARSRLAMAFLFGIVAILLSGLILTKSRGSWLTAAMGLIVCATVVPSTVRNRLGIAALAGTLGAVGAGFAVAGGTLMLIGIGLLRRLTSLSTAATGDISLINRYVESAATWDAIAANPVLGYGWGAHVVRYDIIVDYTYHWGFVHNGYLWMWHKVGIWGLGLFLAVLAGVLWQGLQAARMPRASLENRVFGACGAGSIVAFAILALPSNPFAVLDQMLIVALVLGFTSGVWARSCSPRLASPPYVPSRS